MIKLISNQSIAAINTAANDIITLIKSKKFFIVRRSSTNKERLLPSTEFFRLARLFGKSSRFEEVEAETQQDIEQLKALTNTLSTTLSENDDRYQSYKIKDYSTDAVIKKLCRDLISELEDLYIMGDVSRKGIEEVYTYLEKPLPKKFKFQSLEGNSKKVYSAISSAIRNEASTIKANTITHYTSLVTMIDANQTISNALEFACLLNEKVADLNTIRLAVACRFNHAKFLAMIEDEFESLVMFAATKITDNANANVIESVEVDNVCVGGKGFDINITVNGTFFKARAIPVEGCYVRFHYRYIIT